MRRRFYKNLLERISISVDLKFATVIAALQSHDVSKGAYRAAVVLPAITVRKISAWNREQQAYQVAAVTRGIRLSGRILLSLIGNLESLPAFSYHSREWACTEEISTSPPK
jgi:hypothetical protein